MEYAGQTLSMAATLVESRRIYTILQSFLILFIMVVFDNWTETL